MKVPVPSVFPHRPPPLKRIPMIYCDLPFHFQTFSKASQFLLETSYPTSNTERGLVWAWDAWKSTLPLISYSLHILVPYAISSCVCLPATEHSIISLMTNAIAYVLYVCVLILCFCWNLARTPTLDIERTQQRTCFSKLWHSLGFKFLWLSCWPMKCTDIEGNLMLLVDIDMCGND